MAATISAGSLVLYKRRPAIVRQAGEKLEIEVAEDGGRPVSLKVRPKDIQLLHPGPLRSLSELQPVAGEVETAWELAQGNSLTLAELAELVYGRYTPATAWAAWQLLADSLFFYGGPEQITPRTSEEVSQEQTARQARLASQQAWDQFIVQLKAGRLDLSSLEPEARRYGREIEDLAFGLRPESRVLQALGRAESPQSAHSLLLELGAWDWAVDPYPARLGVSTRPPEVEVPPGFLSQETSRRRDLTFLPAYAIDDEGNQDPDDALSLEERTIWVHVADVASLALPDSALDREARARGASLYLPEGTVPMLPVTAVRQLGLGLSEISPALSFGLELDENGEIVRTEIVPSLVRVQRLTYAQAEQRLDDEPLRSLLAMARLYQARRERQGAVEIELPEVIVKVEDGQVRLKPVLPLQSRELVREAMLMAGEAAGRFAWEQALPFPYVFQESGEGKEPAEGLAGQFALRRMQRRSQVVGHPAPHAGLGLAVYSRATSPLRRYMDLVAHQQLRAFLTGASVFDEQAMLERVGASEAVTGLVAQAEQLARRHWTLVYLLQNPSWQGTGIVVDLRNGLAKVLVPELALEPQVHLPHSLPLNSEVRLGVRQVHLAELEAYFRVLS